jgi:3-oxoacyl-[acyl-carrier-protein] synthase II
VTRRVVLTGVGMLTPLGSSPDAWQAARVAGASAWAPPTRFALEGVEARPAAELRFDGPAILGADRNLRPLDRLSQIVTAAAQLALADAGLEAAHVAGRDVGLCLGTMFCGVHTIAEFDRRGLERGPSYVSPFDFANTVINAAAGQTAIWHNLTGVNSTVSGAAAAGVQALGQGFDLIQSGRAELVLAGGADELSFESYLGFARAGLLGAGDGGVVPFDARRNGFMLAEGAALLVLESGESAAARGAQVLGEILGWGSAFDPGRGRDLDSSAAALARAVTQALTMSATAPEAIDACGAGACGSPTGDLAEGLGLQAALGTRAATVPVTALKSMLGEALGASGALQAIDLLSAARAGLLPGVTGLSARDARLVLDVQARPRPLTARRLLVSALGTDGGSAALVLSAGQVRPG